jgi:HK97 family phage major capsid protein
MTIRNLQDEAAKLAVIATEGSLTEEQSVRFDEVISLIENHKTQAEKAARAISLVSDTSVVETVVEEVSSSIGQQYARSGKAGSRERVSANLDIRATLTTDIVVNPTLDKISTPAPKAPLTNLVNITPVTTGDVTVVKAVVSGEGATFTPEGAVKDELALVYSSEVLALGTMTGFIKVSRQALSDQAQLASDIDTELTRNLVRKIEGNIAATLNAENLQTVAIPNVLQGSAVAKGIVDSGEYTANTIILNPITKAQLDVTILQEGGVSPIVNNTLFGMNIVTSSSVSGQTAYVGDFASAMKFYTKGSVDVYSTDADGTDFTKNLVTVLAEARGLAAVVAPSAIVKIDLTPQG